MANSWSKEDRLHYEKSEVWQELEKRIIDTVHRAGILQRKINEKTAMEKKAEPLEGTPEERGRERAAFQRAGGRPDASYDQTSDEVAQDGLRLSEDDIYDEVYDEADDDAYDEVNDDVHDDVLDDLKRLARSAIADGNIKLAYKIERTIDEILEQEVACE